MGTYGTGSMVSSDGLNYVFDGWNTSPDGNDVPYADCVVVTDIADAGENVMLYAQ